MNVSVAQFSNISFRFIVTSKWHQRIVSTQTINIQESLFADAEHVTQMINEYNDIVESLSESEVNIIFWFINAMTYLI